ncbi:MAG TPA: hypothetical protein VK527_06165 [Candidatus Limnocylindrales bacterium]|nr:hypothetical protein [Candidatus Limnocylindrales bacterium]
MNEKRVFIAALILAAALAACAACTATAHNPGLNSKYEYTVGDDIAQRLGGIFRITGGIEQPALVYYDRDKHDIVAEIIGSTDNVEGAKREIGALVEVIQGEAVSYAKKRHSLDLTSDDVTLIYYVDSDQGVPVEVVRREGGKFLVPNAGAQEKE